MNNDCVLNRSQKQCFTPVYSVLFCLYTFAFLTVNCGIRVTQMVNFRFIQLL